MQPDVLLSNLLAGANLLTLAVGRRDADAFHRLAGLPFSLRVTLDDAARAEFLIGDETVPACTYAAREWPPGFGEVLAEFTNQVLGQRSAKVIGQVAGLQKAGGFLIVVLDPEARRVTLAMRYGDRTLDLGTLTLRAEGTA